MYTLNRAPAIQIPGMDSYTVRPNNGGIERGISAIGKGLASYLEEKQLRDALEEANNPKIEQLQRERAATQAELQRAQAETDQVLKNEAYNFVYDTPKPTPDMITPEKEAEVQSYLDFAKNQAPEQKKRGLEPAAYVDAQAPVQEPYYKVGNMEFSAPPDQQALEVIINQGKAKAVEAQDPRLAMDYEQKAKQALADKLRQTYLQLERTEDVPGAVRLHSNIPDGMTTVERQLSDGTWEVYLHPDGRPDEAQLFARGTAKDVFSAIRRSVDPEYFDRAAELQYNRGRQEQADQRAAQQEARYADNAQRQEARYQRQELLSRADLLENAAKERAAVGDIEGAANMKRQADALRQQVFSQPSAGGLGGPVTGSPPGWLVNNESGGNWGAQNDAMGAGGTPGHYGRLQFGVARLREAQQALGQWFTPEEFMANPQLQQAVEAWHQNDINQYIQEQGWDTSGSTRVLGVPMTPGAMFAVAHLGGKDGLRKFIETNGAYNPADRNGTRLSNYAEKGYLGDLQQSPVATQQPAPQQGLRGPVTQPSSPGLTTPPNQPQQGLTAQADDYALKWAKTVGNPPAKAATPEQIEFFVKKTDEALVADTGYAQLKTPAAKQQAWNDKYKEIQQLYSSLGAAVPGLGNQPGGADLFTQGVDAIAERRRIGQGGPQQVPGSFGSAMQAAAGNNRQAADAKVSGEAQQAARQQLSALQRAWSNAADWSGLRQVFGAAPSITVRDATAFVGELVPLYDQLSDADKPAVVQLLQSIYTAFPELAPQQ